MSNISFIVKGKNVHSRAFSVQAYDVNHKIAYQPTVKSLNLKPRFFMDGLTDSMIKCLI